jgi:hypothetical protein
VQLLCAWRSRPDGELADWLISSRIGTNLQDPDAEDGVIDMVNKGMPVNKAVKKLFTLGIKINVGGFRKWVSRQPIECLST